MIAAAALSASLMSVLLGLWAQPVAAPRVRLAPRAQQTPFSLFGRPFAKEARS